jgi:uncharacterized protein
LSAVIVDTGPIVALLDRRDLHHGWARSVLNSLTPPLLTCEPVLGEACFLLSRAGQLGSTVLELVERGVLDPRFSLRQHHAVVRHLMEKYADVPMSLADACLVSLSETQRRARVLTLDRDFLVYRRHGRSRIPLLSPFASL